MLSTAITVAEAGTGSLAIQVNLTGLLQNGLSFTQVIVLLIFYLLLLIELKCSFKRHL